jgi:hypothetical protein
MSALASVAAVVFDYRDAASLAAFYPEVPPDQPLISAPTVP